MSRETARQMLLALGGQPPRPEIEPSALAAARAALATMLLRVARGAGSAEEGTGDEREDPGDAPRS